MIEAAQQRPNQVKVLIMKVSVWFGQRPVNAHNDGARRLITAWFITARSSATHCSSMGTTLPVCEAHGSDSKPSKLNRITN